MVDIYFEILPQNQIKFGKVAFRTDPSGSASHNLFQLSFGHVRKENIDSWWNLPGMLYFQSFRILNYNKKI
jgi:hypothetical protein